MYIAWAMIMNGFESTEMQSKLICASWSQYYSKKAHFSIAINRMSFLCISISSYCEQICF